MPTHKFHIGQPVEFNPPQGISAPKGPYVVTAKLPGLDGVFEYRVRNASEQHDRAALEHELSAITVEDKPPETVNIRKQPPSDLKRKTRTIKQKR